FVSDEQAAELFASHSAILLPYTKQFTAQSGVVFLALAHEIPVVCSEVGGLGDVLDSFQIGTTIHEPTAASLVAAVRQLFAEARTSDLARQIHDAKDHFSWEETARATIAGYSLAEHNACLAYV